MGNTPWASRQAIDVADVRSKTLSASQLVTEVDEPGDAGAGAGGGLVILLGDGLPDHGLSLGVCVAQCVRPDSVVQ